MKQHERINNHLGLIGRGLALVCLAGLGLSAQAAPSSLTGYVPVVENLPGGGWRVVPNQFIRSETAAAAGRVLSSVPSGFVAADKITVAGRAGALAITASTAVSAKDAALAVGRCLSMSTPVCMAVGAAAAVGYAQYRARASAGGGVEVDDGQPQADYVGWKCGSTSGSSPLAACTPQWEASAAGKRVVTPFACTNDGATAPQVSCSGTFYEPGYGNVFRTYTAVKGVTKMCPPVVDFGDPRYSVPGGPSGVDGKCPTGRYSSSTPEAISERVGAFPPAVGDPDWLRAVGDAVGPGGQSIPGNVTVSGPASQTGTPVTTTTTSPTGTKTETVTPSYQYTYNDNKVTYVEGSTTVTNIGGNTTTTTTTNPPVAPQDPKDPCTANPERIGCQQLGAAPDDKVPKLSKTLQYSTEAVGLPGGCPADVSVSINGRSQFVSYAPTCAAASQAAPWVRAGGAIAALLLVLAALREL